MARGAPKGNTNAKKPGEQHRVAVTLSLADERLVWVKQTLKAQDLPVTDATIRRFVRQVGYDALDVLMRQQVKEI